MACERISGRRTVISALAHALLREDAGFHAYQILDAGVRQFSEWGNTEPGRHILIAVARYLAAVPVGDSSTPESRTLTPLIMVRIQVPQPGSRISGVLFPNA
jgi:hypothetical protein